MVSGVRASHTVCHNTQTVVERLTTTVYPYLCITRIAFASLIKSLVLQVVPRDPAFRKGALRYVSDMISFNGIDGTVDSDKKGLVAHGKLWQNIRLHCLNSYLNSCNQMPIKSKA